MKKAILVVSFGTTYDTARESCIESIVKRISDRYEEYTVFTAFSSRIVVSRLRARGIDIMTEVSAMKTIVDSGYEEVVIQPLHLVHGQEFDKLRNNVMSFEGQGQLKKIYLGRPLLYFMGQEEKPDDYEILMNALGERIVTGENEGALFVGHGGDNPGNSAYSVMQMKLWMAKHFNTRVVTLESFPTVEDTISPWYGHSKPKTMHLYLFLLVAGDHATNDIFGEEEEDSVINLLKADGYECVPHQYGLGSLPEIADIFLQHIDDAIVGRYEKRPKDRPEIPNII